MKTDGGWNGAEDERREARDEGPSVYFDFVQHRQLSLRRGTEGNGGSGVRVGGRGTKGEGEGEGIERFLASAE